MQYLNCDRKKKYIDIKQNSFRESINLLLSLDNAQLWKHIYQYHLMQPHKQTHHNYTSPSIHVSHYVKRWAPIIAALTVRDSAPVPLELLLWVATIFFFLPSLVKFIFRALAFSDGMRCILNQKKNYWWFTILIQFS